MTRAPMIAAGIPLLLACTPQAAPETSASAAGAETSCIDVGRIVSRRPEGPRSLRFEMTGGAVYRNELEQSCAPLEDSSRFDVISLELHGSRACRGDRFRIVDPAEARAVGITAFPECRLGRFVVVEARN